MTKTPTAEILLTCFLFTGLDLLNIRISNLFRISEFEFRIYFIFSNALNGIAFSFLTPL